jgi:hypothetical protein
MYASCTLYIELKKRQDWIELFTGNYDGLLGHGAFTALGCSSDGIPQINRAYRGGERLGVASTATFTAIRLLSNDFVALAAIARH